MTFESRPTPESRGQDEEHHPGDVEQATDDDLVDFVVSAMLNAVLEERIQLQPVTEEFLFIAVQGAFSDPSPRMRKKMETTLGKNLLSDLLVETFIQVLKSDAVQAERNQNDGQVSFITLFTAITQLIGNRHYMTIASYQLCDEDE